MTTGASQPAETPRYLACVWTGADQIGAERVDAFPPIGGFGSGFLVAPGRVLTAAHVLAGDRWSKVTDERSFRSAIGGLGIYVHVDGRTHSAELLGWDDLDDLALLEIDETTPGLRTPLWPAAVPPSGTRSAFLYEGFQQTSEGMRYRPVSYVTENFHADFETLKHELGMKSGISGGPVFLGETVGVEETVGACRFLGVARLGGIAAGTGTLTAVGAVERMLARYRIRLPSPDRMSGTEADRLGIGEALALRVAPGLDPIVFHTRRLGGRWVKAAHRPLSMRETWLLAGRAVDDEPPPDWMPGHVADGAAAVGLAAAAKAIWKAPVRLPTAQELGELLAAKDGRNGPRCAYEPAAFSRYDAHESLLLPPVGVREWAMDRGATMCLDRSGRADGEFPPAAARTLRLLLDLEARG